MDQRKNADYVSIRKGICAKNGGTTMGCLSAARGRFLGLQLLVIVLCAAFAASPAFGQVGGATLSGTVSDSSGAILPNAQISIKNVSTGLVRTVTSDSDGLYTVRAAPQVLTGVTRSDRGGVRRVTSPARCLPSAAGSLCPLPVR